MRQIINIHCKIFIEGKKLLDILNSKNNQSQQVYAGRIILYIACYFTCCFINITHFPISNIDLYNIVVSRTGSRIKLVVHI